ncbi:uncharacterized protein TNCV_2080681 [Trichonephila clavipes]|nr:uncharacterized protein TNCV_2080681 [Trichonephila clavipes]
MERGSPMLWPSTFPDITLLDFLEGYVENIVYQSSISYTDEMKNQITVAIQNVYPTMLHRTWLEISYKVDMLHAANGSNIEIME